MSNGNKKAGPELAPAWPGRRPSITSLAELAAHLGRELSVSAVDANGWTDLHYAAALDWPATARALLAAGAPWDARLRADREPLSPELLSTLNGCGQDGFHLPPPERRDPAPHRGSRQRVRGRGGRDRRRR